MGHTAENRDRVAAAVRAIVDAAPTLSAEAVERIGLIAGVGLALPVEADTLRIESARTA
ncbi:hypothetical protein MINTM018_04160 [Mycobacterium intracellulare]|uniref:Uncharacterized protein n=1 Tax=Mycobacterium intracellulare TaxID=1767 RepID=A0A7R7MPF9_MYCIT|nr:hypothetical protein MINTM018_04160 [Mycobacterium intracellulare]